MAKFADINKVETLIKAFPAPDCSFVRQIQALQSYSMNAILSYPLAKIGGGG